MQKKEENKAAERTTGKNMMGEGHVPSTSTVDSIFSNIRLPELAEDRRRSSGLGDGRNRRCDLYSVLSKAGSSDLGKIRMVDDYPAGLNMRGSRLRAATGGMPQAIGNAVRLDCDRLRDYRNMSKIALTRRHPTESPPPSFSTYPSKIVLPEDKEGLIDASYTASVSEMIKNMEGAKTGSDDDLNYHQSFQQSHQHLSAALSDGKDAEDDERFKVGRKGKKPARTKSARCA